MSLDAHHHVWDLAVRDQPWTIGRTGLHRSWDFGELRPLLQENDVDGTVVVQTIPVAAETPELLRLAADIPEIVGVIGWVDLTAPDVADRLAELRSAPGGDRLVSIRHEVQDETDPEWLVRADVLRGLRAVGEAGLAYDLLVFPVQLPAALQVVRALPQVRFVLDHGGKPAIAAGQLQPWSAQIAALAVEPNLAVKLSGLITEAGPSWTCSSIEPYGRLLLDSFGPARTMWGSDWPVCTEHSDYAGVLSVAADLASVFDARDQEQVFGGTAGSWYRLPEREDGRA